LDTFKNFIPEEKPYMYIINTIEKYNKIIEKRNNERAKGR